MYFTSFEVGAFATNCYLLACEQTGEAVVIDPGGGTSRILQMLAERGLCLRFIVNTHGHGDHVAGNQRLQEKTEAQVLIHEKDTSFLLHPVQSMRSVFSGKKEGGVGASRFLKEGDLITVGKEVKLKVLHTPGHTPGGICLVGDGFIFTGDTLFAGSIGRTDFPGGSFRALIKSIKEKLLPFPDEFIIYPGHGPSSTIGKERRTNPFLAE